MKRARRGAALAALVLAVATYFAMAGGREMAEMHFNWEWPADRGAERKIALRIEDVSPESRGLFGLRASPSIGDALPDGQVVRGVVLAGAPSGAVSLRVPLVELDGAGPGARVAIGVLGEDVVICLARVPDDIGDTVLDGWLADWDC